MAEAIKIIDKKHIEISVNSEEELDALKLFVLRGMSGIEKAMGNNEYVTFYSTEADTKEDRERRTSKNSLNNIASTILSLEW